MAPDKFLKILPYKIRLCLGALLIYIMMEESKRYRLNPDLRHFSESKNFGAPIIENAKLLV
jgi:hypothetical protein